MTTDQEFSFSGWRAQPDLNRLQGDAGGRNLQPKVMAVLCSLARQAPRVVSKEQLLEDVWGETFVTDEVLTNAIWELRQALGDSARHPRYIETIRGRGYRLLHLVEESVEESAGPLPRNRGRGRWKIGAVAVSSAIVLLWLATHGFDSAAPPAWAPPLEPGTTNPEALRSQDRRLSAQDLYLQGRFLLTSGGQGGRQRALRRFAEAVTRDPSFAPAFAGLADAYPLDPRKRLQVAARTAARRAVELDDGLSEAHLALARVLGACDWNWPQAEEALGRAIALDPRDARARASHAALLSLRGRHAQALEEADAAVALAPSSLRYRQVRIRTLYQSHRFEAASDEARKVLGGSPEARFPRLFLALSHLHQGYLEAAAGQLSQLRPGFGHPGEVGYAYARLGDEAAALRSLDRLLSTAVPSPYQVAQIRTGLGDLDSALEWLERALLERDPHIVRLAVDPIFGDLAQDPKYRQFCRRLGFEPTPSAVI